MNDTQLNLFQMRILWGALLASLVVYLGMLEGGIIQVPDDADPQPMMLTALSAVAMFNGLASVFLPRYFLRNTPPAAVREIVSLPPDMQTQRLVTISFTPFIIGMALAESIAIFGLILGVLGHPLLSIAPFFAAAAMLMLTKFPTIAGLRAPFAEALASRGM